MLCVYIRKGKVKEVHFALGMENVEVCDGLSSWGSSFQSQTAPEKAWSPTQMNFILTIESVTVLRREVVNQGLHLGTLDDLLDILGTGH